MAVAFDQAESWDWATECINLRASTDDRVVNCVIPYQSIMMIAGHGPSEDEARRCFRERRPEIEASLKSMIERGVFSAKDEVTLPSQQG